MPRATAPTRTPWPRWCARNGTRCARSPATARRPKRSSPLPGAQTLIWERTRHLLRLRHTLREFFPAALVAFDDLTAVDTLQLLAAAPDPTSAAALSIDTIEAALRKARRRDRAAKAEAIAAALRAEHLGQPSVVAAAYAVTVRAQVAILTVLKAQVAELEEKVDSNFSKHPGR